MRYFWTILFCWLVVTVSERALHALGDRDNAAQLSVWDDTGSIIARRQPSNHNGRLPLTRRHAKAFLREEEYGVWAWRQSQALKAKYGATGIHKRATGTSYLVNRELFTRFGERRAEI
jgi:hypothetical protein